MVTMEQAKKGNRGGATRGAIVITAKMQEWAATNAPGDLEAARRLREDFYEANPTKASDGYSVMAASSLEALARKTEERLRRMQDALAQRR